MTKIRTAASSDSATKPSKKKGSTSAPKKMGYMERLRMFCKVVHGNPILLFLLGVVLVTIEVLMGGFGGVSYGMLYQFANNGKLSGRADGNVYMRNGRVRGMTVPSNPQTVPQSTQRSNFAFLSSNWNSLTDAQRDTWRSSSFPISDRFGQEVSLSGKELYVALNRNLFNSNNAFIDEAPLPVSVLPPTSLTLLSQLSATHFRLTFTPTPVPAGNTWLIFGTRSLSAGTDRPNPSEYKLLTILPAATTSPQDLSTAYDAVFGTVTVGARVFVKVIAVGNANGIASSPLTDDTIVIA